MEERRSGGMRGKVEWLGFFGRTTKKRRNRGKSGGKEGAGKEARERVG